MMSIIDTIDIMVLYKKVNFLISTRHRVTYRPADDTHPTVVWSPQQVLRVGLFVSTHRFVIYQSDDGVKYLFCMRFSDFL